jgi:hypothetical protein
LMACRGEVRLPAILTGLCDILREHTVLPYNPNNRFMHDR